MVSVRVRGYKIAREPAGPSSSILCHIAGIVRQLRLLQRTFSPQGTGVGQPGLPGALPTTAQLADPSQNQGSFEL